MAATQLERAVYGMAQVDQLLRLKSGTAARWIDGYMRSHRSYPPVIREKSTGDELVTWGEFVECRFLAQYRSAGVPLIHLRPVVQHLRSDLGVPYPLAHRRLFVVGRELVEVAQNDAGLDPALAIVVRTGQRMLPLSGLRLTPQAQAFFDTVDWTGDADDAVAARIRPTGPTGLVVIDPARSFGAPSVKGVRTDVIAEEISAGSPVELVARGYDLTRGDIEAALAFERAA